MRSGSDKMSFGVRLIASPKCVQREGMEESSEHAFFYCLVVRPLCASLLKATQFACCTDNSLPSMPVLFVATWALVVGQEKVLCLLAVMRMVIWTTRMKKFTGHCLSSNHLVASFKHQLKANIRVERGFIQRICWKVDGYSTTCTNLTWHLELFGWRTCFPGKKENLRVIVPLLFFLIQHFPFLPPDLFR